MRARFWTKNHLFVTSEPVFDLVSFCTLGLELSFLPLWAAERTLYDLYCRLVFLARRHVVVTILDISVKRRESGDSIKYWGIRLKIAMVAIFLSFCSLFTTSVKFASTEWTFWTFCLFVIYVYMQVHNINFRRNCYTVINIVSKCVPHVLHVFFVLDVTVAIADVLSKVPE